MATNVSNIKLKKSNIIYRDDNAKHKCKRINVNAVKVWTAEEQFTDTTASIYHGHDEYSAYEFFNIPVPAGETFRIDSITYTTASSYSESNVQVYINGTCIKDAYYTRGPQTGKDDVTVLNNSEIYTANDTDALQLRTRGKVEANQHTDYPRVTITVVYTTGV